MVDIAPLQATESRLWRMSPQDALRCMSEVLYLLTPAVDRSRGRYEPGDVIALILQGRMTLWASVRGEVIEAVGVTQFLHFPRARVLSMPFVGGRDMEHWLQFMDDIIAWGRENGATQIETYDARGGAWLKKLPDWEKYYVTIGRNIT